MRDLEQRITIAREAALENPPTTSYFVFFNNQKDAAIAAQTNLHAEDGHSFRVMEAPGPEEVGFMAPTNTAPVTIITLDAVVVRATAMLWMILLSSTAIGACDYRYG